MGLRASADQARARFYANLATAFDAGLTADQALALVEGGDGRLAAAVRGLGQAVRRGQPLSEGMGRNESFWNGFEIDSLAAGERAGRLPEVLRRLAEYFEIRGRTRQRIVSALIYPWLVLNLAILLPPLYLLVGDGIGTYLAWVVPLLVALYGGGAAIWWTVARGARGDSAERLLLSLPLIGQILRELALADYAFVFGILVATGAPLTEALARAARKCRRTRWRAAGGRVAAAVGEGAAIHEALAREPDVFPRSFVEAVRVGEATGTLDHVLMRSERAARHQVERELERLFVILPVLGYAVAGIVVAWVAIRLLTSLI